ncbi:MAG: energy transducer TonB [Steroidobacteraceae bacterium]
MSIAVLSVDGTLLHTLGDVVGESHELLRVASAAELTDRIVSAAAGVALLDSAAIAEPVDQLCSKLRRQFPDLVLVVAGTTEDQVPLSPLVTDGTVYRFLHKPVSAQRVRLFIEAAMRRHDEEHAITIAAEAEAAAAAARVAVEARKAQRTKPAGPPRAALFAAIAALVCVGAGAWWFLQRETSPGGTSTATPATTGQNKGPATEIAGLLQRAAAALEKGDLVTPETENAAALYRDVLKLAPDNATAQSGIDAVVDKLLASVESAFVAEQLDVAESLLGFARELRPEHARIAFLSTQLAKERERAVLLRARRAAASGNLDRAIEVLGEAPGANQNASLVSETRRAYEQQQVDTRVGDLLRQATDRLRSGAIINPAGNNAQFYIESAAALAPDNNSVKQAQRALANRLISDARTAAEAADTDNTEQLLRAAEQSGVSRGTIAQIRETLATRTTAVKNNDLTRLAGLFNQRLTANRLLTPANDSARFYLDSLQRTDPQHPSTVNARAAFARETLNEARLALARADFTGASNWLGEAERAGAGAGDVGAVRKQITDAQARAAAANTVVAAGSLKLNRYVAPNYPEAARGRGIEGWVEVEFSVMPDGSVADARVLNSEPDGTFDRAALTAVSRWRYEPVMRDGAAVTQRARLRLRFSLQ